VCRHIRGFVHNFLDIPQRCSVNYRPCDVNTLEVLWKRRNSIINTRIYVSFGGVDLGVMNCEVVWFGPKVEFRLIRHHADNLNPSHSRWDNHCPQRDKQIRSTVFPVYSHRSWEVNQWCVRSYTVPGFVQLSRKLNTKKLAPPCRYILYNSKCRRAARIYIGACLASVARAISHSWANVTEIVVLALCSSVIAIGHCHSEYVMQRCDLLWRRNDGCFSERRRSGSLTSQSERLSAPLMQGSRARCRKRRSIKLRSYDGFKFNIMVE
jgi:hypothetical protein